MPYSLSSVKSKIPGTKKLSKKQLEVFVSVVNSEIKKGTEEGKAIAKAYGAANMKKSAIVESITTLIGMLVNGAVGDLEDEGDGIPIRKSLEQELMQETSVVYRPNIPDEHGQWMGLETVSDMTDKLRKGFLEDGNLSLNLWHQYPLPKDEVEVLEVELTKSDMYLDDIYVPEGTSIMTVQYHNKRLWEMRKKGVIGGFSVHGKSDKVGK